MLQAAVARLRALWPDREIDVLTQDSQRLARLVPDTRPVAWSGRKVWLTDQELFGRTHHAVPRALAAVARRTRRRLPRLYQSVLVGKRRVRNISTADVEGFVTAVDSAAAVVVAGAGGVTDHAARWAKPMLGLLEMAADRGIPTAMFGHGLGPLTDASLARRAAQVLPRLALLSLREGRSGPVIARRLGVPDDRILVTGDDAVGLAYAARPVLPGTELGITIRVSRSSGIEPEQVDRLRPILQQLAQERGVGILPIAITRVHRPVGQGEPVGVDLPDAASNRRLLAGLDDTTDGGASAETPAEVMAAIGRCRVVLTGAYHTAVFALAQGIPAVTLVNSRYFEDKMLGLADQFGAGCVVLRLDDPALDQRLPAELAEMWGAAATLRAPLLAAAARQAQLADAAYERFALMVDPSTPVRSDSRPARVAAVSPQAFPGTVGP
jgi:colanic acid/amylovoran biosynthesis protein